MTSFSWRCLQYGYSVADLKVLNRCRLYIKAMTLSNLASRDGYTLQGDIFKAYTDYTMTLIHGHVKADHLRRIGILGVTHYDVALLLYVTFSPHCCKIGWQRFHQQPFTPNGNGG